MSGGLKLIIQDYYSTLRNSTEGIKFKTKSHLAGAILADLYDQYELTKENVLFSETKFFLQIENPIKHIINILDNSKSMTIDNAILLEYKTIKIMKDNKNIKVTLLTAIENLILSPSIGGKLTPEKKEQFLIEINEVLANARLFELIGDDTREFILHQSYDSLLEEIVNRIIDEEDLKDIITDIFSKVKEKKQDDNEEIIEKLAESSRQIIDEINFTFEKHVEKLHGHLDHLGLHTFNQLEIINQRINSIPLIRGYEEDDDRTFDTKRVHRSHRELSRR